MNRKLHMLALETHTCMVPFSGNYNHSHCCAAGTCRIEMAEHKTLARVAQRKIMWTAKIAQFGYIWYNWNRVEKISMALARRRCATTKERLHLMTHLEV